MSGAWALEGVDQFGSNQIPKPVGFTTGYGLINKIKCTKTKCFKQGNATGRKFE
jgi:hypothetical protein